MILSLSLSLSLSLALSQWIWLLHLLFPAYMNGCRCLGGFLYKDVDEETRALLDALKEQNKDVLMVLRDVQIQVGAITARGGGGGGAAAAVALADSNSTGRVPILKATPTGKLKEVRSFAVPLCDSSTGRVHAFSPTPPTPA